MSSQDYRVSQIVVLCKDCGNDVGMYPGRHKCSPADRPPMPAMPSIPLQYQQQSQPQSYSSASSSSRANGRRPPDLNPQLANSNSAYSSSYGSSRTPTNASFQDRANGGRTPTASSFQDRMKERDREKQQREREEREAARRGEDSRLDAPPSSTTPTPTPAGSGTTLWNRLLAAKEVINATITGEEKWPDSDDSDFEGESHVGRVLREQLDKKEEAEMAAKIAELEMTPYNASSGSQSKASGRNQYLRDATKKESAPSIASSTSSGGDDAYSRSLRARTDTGAQEPDRSWSPSSNNNNSLNVTGNRYRTTSDASRDDALSRLEGKSDGDRLNTQISHLGSTSPRVRANSPNIGFRPDPAAQQQYNQQLSPSSANNNYSSSSSQRSVSPSNRRYDSPSPSPSGSSSRYAPTPQQHSPSPSHRQPPYSSSPVPSSSSLRSDAYNRGQPSPGRPEYERRPTFPPTTNPPPSNNNNLGAYGQRQQYQKYQQQQYGSNSNQGNYF